LYPGKDHDITEPYMFCIARENPQRLVDQSVPSYTYKRNVYAQRRKFKTGLKIAHVYKGARGGSQSGVSSAAVSVAGGNMGVEHAGTHTADASDVANPPHDGASLGPAADSWPAGTGQAARRSGGDGGGKQRSKRRKTIKPLPGVGAFVRQGPPGASDGGVLHSGNDAGSPTAAAATAQGKPAPGPAALAGQAAVMGTGAKRWKAVAGSGAKLEAPEPVADVPETLDHTHRHGESQWVKATSAVVGLVQEGRADLTMMAPPMEPIYADDAPDDARALAGQVADGQEVVTLRNHILVAGFPVSIRSFMMAVRNSEAVAHALRDTKGPPSQPHSAASGRVPAKKQQPVLFVSDGPVTDEMMAEMLPFSASGGLYVLRRPPLLSSSLVAAGLHRAMRVVLLTNSADALAAATASNTKASAPELAANGVSAGPSTFDAVIEDSAVIFAYQFINEHFPKVAPRTVCQIVQNDSTEFLKPLGSRPRAGTARQGSGEGSGRDTAVAPNFSTRFAEGLIYSGSLSTTLLAHAYFKPDILLVVEALLSAKITNGATGAIQDTQVLQAEVPERLQNKEYGFVVETLLLENDVLPIGLYRPDGDGRYYVYTNPPMTTVLTVNDFIFVLAGVRKNAAEDLVQAASESQHGAVDSNQ
jgi:hypothetical protein